MIAKRGGQSLEKAKKLLTKQGFYDKIYNWIIISINALKTRIVEDKNEEY